MVITRKIEVFVCESDKEQRKTYYDKLYAQRDIAVKAANICVSVLYMLDTNMACLSDEDKELITFLGVKGQKSTKQNAPYVVCSNYFKGQADMGMISCVIQNAQKMYKDDRKRGMWNRSLRSYKGNMPVPFTAERFSNLRFAEYVNGEGEKREGCFFTLIGVPFQMRFGHDRSGNRIIVERVLNGEYKMCTSSIAFEKKIDRDTGQAKQKVFLYLCVDIPKKEVNVDPKKTLYALLGVMNPIICSRKEGLVRAFDEATEKDKKKLAVWWIGNREEFCYRRLQIQEAVRRCEINNRYAVGGKGRKKKLQALDRWHDKEKNYVDTKLHTYSRMLVDMAVKHGCGTIMLLDQKRRENIAKEDNQKGEPFVLRNWSYYGLKEKIAYKCKMVGIALKEENAE